MRCFRNVPVAEKFMDKEEERQKIPSIIFFLRVLNNSVLVIL